MGTEKFQQIISTIVRACPGVHNIYNNIRVVAKDYAELNERVENVIRKLHKWPNPELSKVGLDSMIFMGVTLISEGPKVSDDKVKAIVQAPRSTSKSELRSVLGLGLFCSTFMAGFAKTEWEWSPKHDSAFDELKRLLCSAYFQRGRKNHT